MRRLNTDYIDIYWVHNLDYMTKADEIIRGLEDLVRSGKVLYIGLSNAPSWLLAQCNTIAERRGWASFAGLQLEYSLAQRSIEAEYFPLLEAFDLNLCMVTARGEGFCPANTKIKRLTAAPDSTCWA
ncbi:aldo/keto reductase [Pseudomaricurvus alkylphenolicus]|nr:aldo/keto reductase [Pseudomaricurvus alkylphenolicus]